MSELLKINVNDHTEKKNNLTYLSWAWAWAKVLEIDPQATWDAIEFNGAPCTFLPDGSAMVKVLVTIKGHSKTCWLPVMDHRNKAIKNPDAFAVNTALVRCLTKCISMHGLGLYIYAGEDLPDGEDKPEPKGDAPMHSPKSGVGDELPEDWKIYLRDMATQATDLVKRGKAADALDLINEAKLEADQHTYMDRHIDSATRSALKKVAAGFARA